MKINLACCFFTATTKPDGEVPKEVKNKEGSLDEIVNKKNIETNNSKKTKKPVNKNFKIDEDCKELQFKMEF